MRLFNPLRRFLDHLRASVRAKLLFLVLAPLLIGFPIIMALVWYWSNTSYHKLLIFKVGSDLVTAHEYFDRVVNGIGARLEAAAGAQRLQEAMGSGRREAISAELDAVRRRDGLDFVYLLDRSGQVRHAVAAQPDALDHARWPVVDHALHGRAGSVIDIYDARELEAIDASLRDRASLNIVPTAQAAPDARQSETRGMIVHAAAPVIDSGGQLLGVVEGGMLLNGNLGFVDAINAIVYRDGSLPLGSRGTATLFLGDTRIATNVRLFEGERALGTRVSQSVREFVLERGNTWLDTAFVVNDWYVSAYEPVLDSFGQRVGMLYVGFLEEPFRSAKEGALALIFILFAVISLFGCAWSLHWARSIFRPIEAMNLAIARIDGGDADARVGATGSRDELGRLASEFDHLLDVLAQKRNELQRWADDLDFKVVERTAELEQANGDLRLAHRQLAMSEKLAAIGELTAGVAHEINNPIAVIQGNLDVLREVLGPASLPVDTEIRLIDEQVSRIRVIVAKLLQFARPGEFAGYVEAVDCSAVLADCLLLSRHHLSQCSIRLEQTHATTRSVGINRQELQQVLINLLVNAVQAMPDGGTLTLASGDWDEDGVARGVRIDVRDSGEGIRPEDVGRIFDPFFTTKKTRGTGLGLSISYSLIARYGGRLTVDSEYGAGALFSVWLLSEPEYVVPESEKPGWR
ncbi:MAG: cache domain-containing protein [Rhodocyclaceae bacterium]